MITVAGVSFEPTYTPVSTCPAVSTPPPTTAPPTTAPAEMAAIFKGINGVWGSIRFKQSGTGPLRVEYNMAGLDNAAGWHIHLKAVDDSRPTDCSAAQLGGHLNPTGVNYTSPSYVQGNYEAGDLTGKFGSWAGLVSSSGYHTDIAPLLQMADLVGKSITVHKNDATKTRWVCANILPIDSSVITAVASFTGTLLMVLLSNENG